MNTGYDNYEISNWKKCFRLGYLTHLRHWVPDRSAYPLLFGICIHAGLDIIWLGIQAGRPLGEVLDDAIHEFNKAWLGEGYPLFGPEFEDDADDMKFRTPDTGAFILGEYIDRRAEYIKSVELLGVEKPFIVKLPTGWDYNGVIDKVLREFSFLKGWEHKTTAMYSESRRSFQPNFMQAWDLDSQTKGYARALRILYDDPDASMAIDGLAVHASARDFIVIPLDPPEVEIETWAAEVGSWINRIEAAKNAYIHEGFSIAEAFPKNDQSCFQRYGTCGMFDLCRFCEHPEEEQEPPQGYRFKPWNPAFRRATDKGVEATTINLRSNYG